MEHVYMHINTVAIILSAMDLKTKGLSYIMRVLCIPVHCMQTKIL